ncbi:dermonecrotic toxin domain-containing protein [Pseudomonas sp. NPDC087598]|uniref:dermonecrotic toxin domain-containing protein n=1 Tax=Pseudomonas sp. NPDC087598 TaxID=3364440 RepID=UPI00382E8936
MTLPLEQQPGTPTNDNLLTQVFNEINDWDKATIVEKCLSGKLPNADQTRIAEYRSALKKALALQTFFETLLPSLDTPNKFCGRILRDELRKTYGTRFRVQDIIRLVPKARSEKAKHACTLLQAAMLNFTNAEAAANYFSADSATLSDAQDTPADSAANVQMTAQVFAALSRKLDLGDQYQKLITRTFEEPNVQLQAVQLGKLNMRMAAYNRYFSKDIQQFLLFMLTQFTEGNDDILNGDLFNNAPIQLCSVQIFGKYLVNAVLIICRLTHESTQDRYLLYVPDDKGSVFYHTDNEDNCRISLAASLLGQSSLRSVFAAQLNRSDQNDFLNEKLGVVSFTKDISFTPLSQGLFEYLFKRQLDKFASDVKQLAVPVAEVNQSMHDKRRENRALQQRPSLSETLMYDFNKRIRAGSPDALLSDVFSGVEDWTFSEKLLGLNALLNLKEKLSPADANSQSDSEQPLDTSAEPTSVFFKKFELQDHSNPQKNALLWKRTLSGYEQKTHAANRIMDQAYPDDDDQRVRNYNGRHFIRVAGSVYEVEPNPLAWRIRHPLNEAAYRPPVVYSPGSGWNLQHKRSVVGTTKTLEVTEAADTVSSLPAATPPAVL